jgi:EpsI family protein
MAAAASAAYTMTPHIKLAQLNGGLNLEAALPKTFANWQTDTNNNAGVINPQTDQLLKATYSQTLSRVYVNEVGQRLMLSIAYGEDQTDGANEIHHPEVCYPAQGFSVLDQRSTDIPTGRGTIRATRLVTNLGRTRVEPVTYWIVIGNEIALNAREKKMAELRHGLRGEIVDGTLFRTSTIDADINRSFAVQEQFTSALVEALAASDRKRLTALD